MVSKVFKHPLRGMRLGGFVQRQKKTRPPPESGDGGWESWIVSPSGTKGPSSWTPQPMDVGQKAYLSLCAQSFLRERATSIPEM